MKHIENDNSYDQVPYQNLCHPQSHPAHLAAIGRLLGMSPAPIAKCRVLEMGCAAGANLIPMACLLPDSEFVGVEASRRQAEAGQKTIRDLGLKNIEIRHEDIADIDDSYGKFGYVIAHGVYSLVGEDIREMILRVSSANLSRNGIAYISYNTYPGWHTREMMREMMLYHAEQFSDPAQKIGQARALSEFLTSSVPAEKNPYAMLLKHESEIIGRSEDWYLFHDYLEQVNAPVYFHQFVEKADRHDLQYLGESDFSMMLPHDFPPKVAETLDRINRNNIIHTEQYMDFLRNRAFRQTLLCHKTEKIRRNVRSEDVRDLLISSGAFPEKEQTDLSPGVEQNFVMRDGRKLQTDSSLIKAILLVLGTYWPRAADFETLSKQVSEELGKVPASKDKIAQDNDAVAGEVLRLYITRGVELRTWQPEEIAAKAGSHPKASRVAAYYAKQGAVIVPNLRHEMIRLEPSSLYLLGFLDGTRTRKQIIKEFYDLAKSGKTEVREQGNLITDPKLIVRALDKMTSEELNRLAAAALLES